ncbi:mitochondrion biogenesis protein [Diplodia corticola]|uniref:Sensitive to high expression protein 9, mitochondrial n=1 Tax=Diplodia corticola TaxID=236234 RepID=A0A1J9S4V1_9PEZI|nr:mitochondrion biogenesis protein [Diplodia corticola]OJD35551.1 mitochondrion biogenesis protein [Diplodia corticola]
MRPALQHAARSLTDYAVLTFAQARPGAAAHLAQPSSVCFQCKLRAFSAAPLPPRTRTLPPPVRASIRQWSSTARLLQEKPPPGSQDPQLPAVEDAAKRSSDPSSQKAPELPPSPTDSVPSWIETPPPPSREPESSHAAASPPPQPERVEQVPDEKLPSHRQGLRWEIYKRASAYFDELLPKLILVGQKVNSYTGTDYSGIEALRQEIKQQERFVKSRRAQVEDAKRELEAALSQQQASQKEVVGLLERKHSWSATDLERYMSLIRSEHLNDQAVRSAKDAVLSADRALEEARAHLEKRERAQYHEEQIWSDTIRRNSTWVTIGLMGANILLLLSQLVAIEPWRRRRLVREIKNALDERTMTAAAPAPFGAGVADLATTAAATTAPEKASDPAEAAEVRSADAVEKEIDDVVEPAGVPLERVEPTDTPETVTADRSGPEPTMPLPLPETTTVEASPVEATPVEAVPVEAVPVEAAPVEATRIAKERPTPTTAQEKMAVFAQDCSLYMRDLFSERAVSVRKVDVTAAALQGAAAGAALMGMLVLAFLRADGSN